MDTFGEVIGGEFARIIAAVEEINKQSEEDYTGADGLLYCGVCHVKKQHRLAISNREYLLPSSCHCKMSEWHAMRAEKIREDREKNRANWIKDEQLRTWNFKTDDGSNAELTEIARRYVENWDEMQTNNVGLLFCGSVGNGKTVMAACIANELIDRDFAVELTNISAIESRAEFKDDRLHQIVTKPDLLILDDFGAERSTSTMENVTFRVIDYRVKSGKPFIITTNVPLATIKSPGDMNERRIYDRILEVCHPVENTAASRRRQKAAQRYGEIADLLGIKKAAQS